MLRILRNTEGASVIGEILEYFVEDQFVAVTDENDDNQEEDQTTSYRWLFESLATDDESHVDTLKSNQRRQPVDETTGTCEKVVQRSTQDVIYQRWSMATNHADDQMHKAHEKEAQTDLIDHT